MTAVDIPAIYRRAAELIRARGAAPEGVEIGPDGELAVDAACRLAAGLPARDRNLHPSDEFTHEHIMTALRVDLGMMPAAWTGDTAKTIAVLEFGAAWREEEAAGWAVAA